MRIMTEQQLKDLINAIRNESPPQSKREQALIHANEVLQKSIRDLLDENKKLRNIFSSELTSAVDSEMRKLLSMYASPKPTGEFGRIYATTMWHHD